MSATANENAPAVSSNSGEGNDRTPIEGTTLTANSTTDPLFDGDSLDVLASQLGDLAGAHAAGDKAAAASAVATLAAEVHRVQDAVDPGLMVAAGITRSNGPTRLI